MYIKYKFVYEKGYLLTDWRTYKQADRHAHGQAGHRQIDRQAQIQTST